MDFEIVFWVLALILNGAICAGLESARSRPGLKIMYTLLVFIWIICIMLKIFLPIPV